MKLEQKYSEMLSGYQNLVSQIMPQPSVSVVDDPAKLEWAKQEGFRPEYDPNTDQVSWVQQPKPAYQQPHIMNLEASMSPERLQESYPAFAWKAQHLDPLLQEIIQKALGGEITTQRAKELAYQLAINTFDEAWKEGKPKGSGKGAVNFEQAVAKATKKSGVAG